MKKLHWMNRVGALALAGILSVTSAGAVLASDAGSASQNGDLPFEMILDMNVRQQPVYDGYSQYVDAYRVSDEDTFHIVPDSADVDLSQASMDYLVITYDEEGTQISQECSVSAWRRESITRWCGRRRWLGRRLREPSIAPWTAVIPSVSILGIPGRMFISRCSRRWKQPSTKT